VRVLVIDGGVILVCSPNRNEIVIDIVMKRPIFGMSPGLTNTAGPQKRHRWMQGIEMQPVPKNSYL
jgi:hypothetical protein